MRRLKWLLIMMIVAATAAAQSGIEKAFHKIEVSSYRTGRFRFAPNSDANTVSEWQRGFTFNLPAKQKSMLEAVKDAFTNDNVAYYFSEQQPDKNNRTYTYPIDGKHEFIGGKDNYLMLACFRDTENPGYRTLYAIEWVETETGYSGKAVTVYGYKSDTEDTKRTRSLSQVVVNTGGNSSDVTTYTIDSSGNISSSVVSRNVPSSQGNKQTAEGIGEQKHHFVALHNGRLMVTNVQGGNLQATSGKECVLFLEEHIVSLLKGCKALVDGKKYDLKKNAVLINGNQVGTLLGTTVPTDIVKPCISIDIDLQSAKLDDSTLFTHAEGYEFKNLGYDNYRISADVMLNGNAPQTTGHWLKKFDMLTDWYEKSLKNNNLSMTAAYAQKIAELCSEANSMPFEQQQLAVKRIAGLVEQTSQSGKNISALNKLCEAQSLLGEKIANSESQQFAYLDEDINEMGKEELQEAIDEIERKFEAFNRQKESIDEILNSSNVSKSEKQAWSKIIEDINDDISRIINQKNSIIEILKKYE
ncbi:MAG: TM1812 family CRISPR-associated protein [Muribaculaceae bacterium]